MADDPAQQRTRISPVRAALVLVCVAAAGAAAFFAFGGGPLTSRAVAAQVPTVFAGYVDVTATPTQHFESPATPSLNDVILAFIVADKTDPCMPTWGTYYTLDKAAADIDLDRRIEQLRLIDGNVRVSFGGAINDELAVACTDPAALEKAYADVVARYQLQSIDLDIEGPALGDTASLARRAQAIKSVQAAETAQNRKLDVWLTLPTNTNGLTEQGLNALNSMLSAGVDVSGVNGMTMNFGATKLETDDMSNSVEKAAVAMQKQVARAFADAGLPADDATVWAKIGLTPMIGQNDEVTEQFTIGDAKSINVWALNKGVGLLSMWSINRDITCGPPLPKVSNITRTTCSGVDQKGQSFADVLAANTHVPALPESVAPSAGPTPSPIPGSAIPSTEAPAPIPTTSPSGPQGLDAAVVDDPALSPYPIWDPETPYPANVKVTWHQQVYQAKRWSTGFAPDTQVEKPEQTPWRLVGPVRPGGEKPLPLPSVAPGTYPEWDPAREYPQGSRVQLNSVPYISKWTNSARKPDPAGGTKNPWSVMLD